MTAKINRRDFITTASLAAGALAVNPRSAWSTNPLPLKPLRLAVKYNMIRAGETVRGKFDLLRDIGFDGVEINSPGHPDLEEIIAASEATGVAVPGVVNAVHWHKPLSDPDPAVRGAGVEGLRTAINTAATVGASMVLLVPAVVNAAVSYAEAYTRSQKEIRRVLPLAREKKIQIAIENVWNNFLLSPLEAAQYVDELNDDGGDTVGWYFDVGNIVNYGWPHHWIETLGDRIIRLDIKEFSRAKRDKEGLWKGFNVEIGEGDCDWPRVMKALHSINYDGWAVAEVGGGDRARLTDIYNRMKRVLARHPEEASE